MADARLEAMLALVDEADDDDLLKDLDSGNAGDAEASGARANEGEEPSLHLPSSHQNLADQAGNNLQGPGPMTTSSRAISAARSGGLDADAGNKRKAVQVETVPEKRKDPKRSKKDKGKEQAVTVVPLEERFLHQSFEEWKADPFSASLRVISQYREVERIRFEQKLTDLRADLEKERERGAALKEKYSKKSSELEEACGLLARAKVTSENSAKTRKALEDKVANLEAQAKESQGTVNGLKEDLLRSSTKIESLESELADLKSSQNQTVEATSAGGVNVAELQERLRATQVALKESRLKSKEAR